MLHVLHSLSNVQTKDIKSLVLLTSPVTGDVEMSWQIPQIFLNLQVCISNVWYFENLFNPLLNLGREGSLVNVKWNDHNSASDCVWESIEREHSLENVVGFLNAHHHSLLVLFKPLISSLFLLNQGKLICYRTLEGHGAGFFQST